LHARSRVKHGCQQSIISATICSLAINPGEDGFDLCAIEVFDYPLVSAFERNAQNTLGLFEVLGLLGAYVAKECMDRGEPDIASRR
jgi:hypothetical protein